VRRRTLIGGLLAAAMLTAVPSSEARTPAQLLFITTGGRLISQTDIPFTETGGLTVSFAGSEAAGCAARGVCPYSGRIETSSSGGDLLISKLRIHHRIAYQLVAVNLSGLSIGPTAAAQVVRSLPGGGVARCADLIQGQELTTASPISPDPTFRLLDSTTDLVATRCAGPTDAGINAAVPQAKIPIAVLERGRMSLPFTGTARFSAGGFAGTVSSTIVVKLGPPRRQQDSSGSSGQSSGSFFGPRVKRVRYRTASETLKLLRVRGRIDATVSGVANPTICSLLDSCGLVGTIALQPRPATGSAALFVSGRARIPDRRFLAGLGLDRASRPLGATGVIAWQDPGQAAVRLTQGSQTCNAATPYGGSVVNVQSVGQRFALALATQSPLRSECPGPFFNTAEGGTVLATASVPRSVFGRRTFSIRLHAGGDLTDDGYVMRLRGSLTLTLRRGRLSQRIDRAPVGV
jgi:hypothetical protein